MWLDSALGRYQNALVNIRNESYAILTQRVIMGTPVDSGSLRASWTASIGSYPQVNNIDTSSGGRNSYTGVINSLQSGDTYNLANGQPYAYQIEFMGRSRQAPAGMMRVAAAEWPQIVSEVARRWSAN